MAEGTYRQFAARALQEVWAGRTDALHELYAANFVGHSGGAAQPVEGRESVRLLLGRFHELFPDLAFRIEDQVAEDDRVVTRWRASATYAGDPEHVPGLDAIDVAGITIHRFDAEGRIAESWTYWDAPELAPRLRAVPDAG